MAAAPAINGRWEDDRIAISPTIDIGVGTALGDKGLVVPVVRDAGALSLEQIGAKLDDLTRRARAGTEQDTAPAMERRLLAALPERSLDRLFLLFPDPWPKARHAKRRFVHPALLPAVARALKPGAEWRVATDDPTYQAWVAEVFSASDLFELPPPAAVRPEGWPPTRYEAKALREGRAPLYWTARRRFS